jgi:hypothetical protein
MSINIEVAPQELADIRQYMNCETDALSIQEALRDYVRIRRLRELKLLAGRVEFDDNWQQLEEVELKETELPH